MTEPLIPSGFEPKWGYSPPGTLRECLAAECPGCEMRNVRFRTCEMRSVRFRTFEKRNVRFRTCERAPVVRTTGQSTGFGPRNTVYHGL